MLEKNFIKVTGTLLVVSFIVLFLGAAFLHEVRFKEECTAKGGVSILHGTGRSFCIDSASMIDLT